MDSTPISHPLRCSFTYRIKRCVVATLCGALLSFVTACDNSAGNAASNDIADDLINSGSSGTEAPVTASTVTASTATTSTSNVQIQPNQAQFSFRILDSDAITISSSISKRISQFMLPALDAVNRIVELPGNDVPVTLTGCGVANAFYSSAMSEIFLCMELLEEAFDAFFEVLGNDQDNAELLAERFLMFTTYHEIAHVLVDKLELPIAGNAESAADAIAAVISVERNLGQNVLFASYLFTLSGDGSFGDIHPGGTDRAGDLICWALGGEPSLANSESGKALSQSFINSGRDCTGEYQQQLSAVSTWLPRLAQITTNDGRPPQPTSTSSDFYNIESTLDTIKAKLRELHLPATLSGNG